MVKKRKQGTEKYSRKARGSWMKPYTWSVLSFSILMMLVYMVSIGLLGYRIANPLITENPQSLTFGMTKSEALFLGLSEENAKRFRELKEEEFQAKQGYFHKIALEDQSRYLKNRMIQAGAYLALWLLVFLVHRNMLGRIRFFGV